LSRPVQKVDPHISPQARLHAYYEQKAEEFEVRVRQLEGELLGIADPAKRPTAQRRITRLAGTAAGHREKAERLVTP
jgi:hypothetical protein